MRYELIRKPANVLLEIAQKHKRLRKEQGLSQFELAERSGVSLASIKRFERTGQISLESLLKLMHVLNRLDDFNAVLNYNEDLKNIEKLFSKKTRRS